MLHGKKMETLGLCLADKSMLVMIFVSCLEVFEGSGRVPSAHLKQQVVKTR